VWASASDLGARGDFPRPLCDPAADRHHQHKMVVVPLELGVEIRRMFGVGLFDAPTARRGALSRRAFARSSILGTGRVSRSASGSAGGIHHCIAAWAAERSLELMIEEPARAPLR